MDESQTFELLPTGKTHISFSEVRDWKDCSFRHKLKYVKKIDLGRPGPLLDFGTAVHASCENFLKTRAMNAKIATDIIESVWDKNKLLDGFDPKSLPNFLAEANSILEDVPSFMDKTFPEWEFLDAEHQLYEPIDGHKQAFKGFIDGVIKCKNSKGKDIVWLIDWKTTSWGWGRDKKEDPMVRTQLILYKNYWSSKMKIDPKNVRCAFVLLKRSAKPGNHCELVTTSVGDVTTGRSLKVINNMISCVKKGVAIKNKASCTYCDYKATEHCP